MWRDGGDFSTGPRWALAAASSARGRTGSGARAALCSSLVRAAAAAALPVTAACYRPPGIPVLDGPPSETATAPCAPPRSARVACVVDGDTLDLGRCGEGGERVRLLGLSAPELHGPGAPECWADASRDALAEAVGSRRVELSFDADCADAWGRTLAYVWLDDGLGGLAGDPLAEALATGPDGLLVNEWAAAAGHARVFGAERFGALIWQTRLEAAQAGAEHRREGLWGACLSPSG